MGAPNKANATAERGGPRSFFVGWEIWQQLCFVLACLIGVVLVLGVSMKIRNTAKVNKLESQNAERAERGEMAETVRVSDEVPFGVRAIEAGCEVEGIWNSKTTTPLHTPTPSTSGSATPVQRSRRFFKPRRAPSLSSILSLRTPQPAHIRSNAPEDVSRPQELPQIDLRSSHTQSKPDPRTSNGHARPKSHTVIIGGRRNSGYDSEQISSPTVVDTIERMRATRRRQSAETGQLVPRTRCGTGSEPRTELAPSIPNCGNDKTKVRSTSWPIGNCDGSPGTPASGRASQSVTVPFRSFVKTNRIPEKAPPSAWTEKTRLSVTEKIEHSGAAAAPPLMTESFSHLNENTRIVNNGFEVLPVGTFDQPPSVKEFGLWAKPVPANDKCPDLPKKLQKRDRVRSRTRSSSSEHAQPGKEEPRDSPPNWTGRWLSLFWAPSLDTRAAAD